MDDGLQLSEVSSHAARDAVLYGGANERVAKIVSIIGFVGNNKMQERPKVFPNANFNQSKLVVRLSQNDADWWGTRAKLYTGFVMSQMTSNIYTVKDRLANMFKLCNQNYLLYSFS